MPSVEYFIVILNVATLSVFVMVVVAPGQEEVLNKLLI